MKILLMEKFDGISSQIPLLNGRDPRLTISQSFANARVTESDGLLYDYVASVAGNQITVDCSGITSLNPNGRYSFIFNGMRNLIKVTRQYGGITGNEHRDFLGIPFDNSAPASGTGTHVFKGVTGDTRLDKFNLEMVYDNGVFSIYVNGLLKATRTAPLSNRLILLRVDGTRNHHGSVGYMYKDAGPILELGEIIIVELEEGEKRVGNCRLERLPVKDVSENLQDPENVTPVNLASNTFSTVGQDEVDISLELPTVNEHEKVIGVDFRTSAVSTPNGSQMRVRLNDGDEDVHDTILHLPQVHTRASTCQVTPPQQVGDKPEDYSGYRLYISATEDGV